MSAPACAKAMAMARPMPRLPPVTTALRPASEKRVISSPLAGDSIARRLGDERRGQAALLGQFLRLARRGPHGAHADELDGAGPRRRQRFRHRAAEPAMDVVVLA